MTKEIRAKNQSLELERCFKFWELKPRIEGQLEEMLRWYPQMLSTRALLHEIKLLNTPTDTAEGDI